MCRFSHMMFASKDKLVNTVHWPLKELLCIAISHLQKENTKCSIFSCLSFSDGKDCCFFHISSNVTTSSLNCLV